MSSSASTTEIWATSDWATNETLLILLTGIGLQIGFWGHDLTLEQGMDRGTVLPHIQRAKQEGWSVLVLNPNKNVAHNQEIQGHNSPEQHFRTVWDRIIEKTTAKRIFMITHSYGGVCLVHLLENKPDIMERLTAVAMNDCGGVRTQTFR